jgi:glutathione S-transferase
MTLTLHFHPLSSFCQKVLIGLYELELPFERQLVDLSNEQQRAAFLALWPMGRFPVLHDDARGLTVPESSIVLEYLDQHYAGGARLIPSEPERALTCRLRDRLFDQYVNLPVGKIVTDKLRPDGQHDLLGVEQARQTLETAYGIAESWLHDGAWAVGDQFTMADCAAAPALFYANRILPFEKRYPKLTRYFARLSERPSFARAVEEAKPYLSLFPG